MVGTVQGVGFRPFVHRLATELGLTGWVTNDSGGVTIEVLGPAPVIDVLLHRISASAPPLATVESVSTHWLAAGPDEQGIGFSIRESATVIHDSGGAATPARATAMVPADVRTCDACLGELWDPSNRRYRHPFINCTDCGPRFTIIESVPYDRASTTMAPFAMCDACALEYHDPTDRRFHANRSAVVGADRA